MISFKIQWRSYLIEIALGILKDKIILRALNKFSSLARRSGRLPGMRRRNLRRGSLQVHNSAMHSFFLVSNHLARAQSMRLWAIADNYSGASLRHNVHTTRAWIFIHKSPANYARWLTRAPPLARQETEISKTKIKKNRLQTPEISARDTVSTSLNCTLIYKKK